MKFDEKISVWSKTVNAYLKTMVLSMDLPHKSLYEAMNYSLMAGGKRIRPILGMAVCELLDGVIEDVLPYACAIEMIHTYSLIHDDLPSMDDDDYRRGIPTNHKRFGEAMAILAGDALLNKAFEHMLKDILASKEKQAEKTRASLIIAGAAGAEGMIAGQVVDLESEGKKISIDRLKYMHKCKTGAIISASLLAPAEICGASEARKEALGEYAQFIGLAFQIKDDILDVESSLKELGKPVGSDNDNLKSTYVSIYGLDKAKEILSEITEKALSSLEVFGDRAAFLKELAIFISERKN